LKQSEVKDSSHFSCCHFPASSTIQENNSKISLLISGFRELAGCIPHKHFFSRIRKLWFFLIDKETQNQKLL